jgi:hypothetical protein
MSPRNTPPLSPVSLSPLSPTMSELLPCTASPRGLEGDRDDNGRYIMRDRRRGGVWCDDWAAARSQPRVWLAGVGSLSIGMCVCVCVCVYVYVCLSVA